MFGRPKRAKAQPVTLAQPTAEEAVKVFKSLAKMYPQMYDPNWGKPKKTEPKKTEPKKTEPKKTEPKRETVFARIKRATAEADASLRNALTPEEINKSR